MTLRVQPGSKRNRVLGKLGADWKIAVAAPPVDGKANRACLKFLAKLTGRPKSAVVLLRGPSSRVKTFEIDGLTDERLEKIFSEASE